MPREKKVYVCRECGADFPQAYGRCPACGAWGSIAEFHAAGPKAADRQSTLAEAQAAQPRLISEVDVEQLPRIDTHDSELNSVLGGGLVPGSLVLIGGEPGIGKSTLVLQAALRMEGLAVLYASGEESAAQIKMRADRIGPMLSRCYVMAETRIEAILDRARELRPDVLVVDSIQTVTTDRVDISAGSISQVRESSNALLRYAKQSGVPVLIIGHITKEGSIAGPKILEHIVDTVLQFEGDAHFMHRILRAHKNRFGSTDRIAIYEMEAEGLREVTNPSELFLSHDTDELSGIACAATIEGARPFLIETQALVSTTAYNYPQRSATGFDLRRMNMLLAVLEKRAGFKLPQKDVFLNIAGGLRVADPAVDLATIAAILSSNLDLPIPRRTCLAGEVGLSGEIRPVARIEQRIAEAERLGFNRIIVPEQCVARLRPDRNPGIQIVGTARVEQAFRLLFA